MEKEASPLKDARLEAALACLSELCADESVKPADRIAAAKLLLEHALKAAPDAENTVRVVLEGVPESYLT